MFAFEAAHAGKYTLGIPRTLLASILGLALVARLVGIGFGLPLANARPDETTIAGEAVQFLGGNFRPQMFIYPTFMMDVVALIYMAYYLLGRPFTHYTTLTAFLESRRQDLAPFLYLTRGLSAIMGTLTVWWVYEIARRVFDSTVALVAALFLALSFLHVRDSHFGVTDVMMTALVVLAVLEIVQWHQTGERRHAVMAGLVAGLATSTKYNGLGVAVPFAVAAALRIVGARTRAAEVRCCLGAAVLFGALVAAGFFGPSPYILIEWRRFLSDVGMQQATFVAGHGIPIARGWWYHASHTLPVALGWPVYLASLAGVAGLLAIEFRRSAVILSFPLTYYIVAGSGQTVFARYIIPVLPFLCMTAAWFVVTVVGKLTVQSAPPLRRVAIAVAGLLLVAPSARSVALMDRLLSRQDNRLVAGRALEDLVPVGSTLYQSSGPYGLPVPSRLAVHEWRYDETTGGFSPDGRLPDWIVLQRSPLALYSHVAPGLERLVREHYHLVAAFPADRGGAGRTYDQQDAFFLPLDHLEQIDRPGPSFEIYRRL